MTNIAAVLAQLKQERNRLDQAIVALEGLTTNGSSGRRSGTRKLSAAGRARIAAAQRARWARFKEHQKKRE
jgi:hypothetical protein